jgi:hypothetical protein
MNFFFLSQMDALMRLCSYSDYPYIKGVGNLSSPGCSEINVMSIFITIPRPKRSHGHKRIQHPNVKKSSKPRTLQDTLITSIPLLANEIWRDFLLLS